MRASTARVGVVHTVLDERIGAVVHGKAYNCAGEVVEWFVQVERHLNVMSLSMMMGTQCVLQITHALLSSK